MPLLDPSSLTVLAIESSCDDTAAAVSVGGRIVSSVVSSQPIHDAYGGVVPELASRDHQRQIVRVVRRALSEGGVSAPDLDAIAVTYGPGLAGSLLVGIGFAKAYALGLGIPLVGVNHLEGHLYSLFIDEPAPPFPFLCLIVSGGHTQLARVSAGFESETLGRTRDDAAGEAFDKVAKLLGLPYPGGPEIDRLAASGDPTFASFPRTMLRGLDFSFSGIKTSVLYYLNAFSTEERAAHLKSHTADLCASFQAAVVEMLVNRVKRAVVQTEIRHVGLVGGVSANRGLRLALDELADRMDLTTYVPDTRWCMDNAAMVAVAGHHRMLHGQTSPLTLTAQPSLAL